MTFPQLRPRENDLSTLNSTGIPAPLGSYFRKPRQDTRSLVPDDGYRIMKTSNQQQHQDPAVHATKSKHVLSMINRYNWHEFSMADRPINCTREGFGSLLPNHNR